MITVSDELTGVLTGSYSLEVRIESWLSGGLLSASVPVSTGGEEVDRTLNVPERISFTVPRIVDDFSWAPIYDQHPLAANGQRIRVLIGVPIDAEQTEYIQRGWFVIQDSEVDGDVVNVTAVGMLDLILEARLISPYQPTGTLASTLRGLVEPALTVTVDAGLVDRAVPTGINYDEDRLGAVNELLDAWPAEAYVNPDGVLSVIPTTQSLTPVLSLTNGVGGTVIRVSGESTREGGYSCVVARGTATDGGQVQGVVYDTSGGPKDIAGPFNPLPVPYFYQSPLLTTVAQASAAAATILARLQRTTQQELEIELVPNPTLQVGDVVSLTSDDYTDLLCSIEALTLPYTASGGAMTLKVRTLE